MRAVDISIGYHAGMRVTPAGGCPPARARSAELARRAASSAAHVRLHLATHPHIATHVESAALVDPQGETLDKLPLERFIGRACIADLSYKGPGEPIGAVDLESATSDIWRRGDRLLIRTDHLFRQWGAAYHARPPYLLPSAADWAVERGAALVGVDCDTEQSYGAVFAVHERLLAAGIPILEQLTNLQSATHRVVLLVAVPLKLKDQEAIPVRAVILEDTNSL